MSCHDARERFSELIDDALDPATRTAVDAHVAGCPECRRELDRLDRTVALLRAVEPVRAPVGFVDRVLDAATPAPWYRRVGERLARVRPRRFPVEAAAVVLLATLAVYVFDRTPELQQAAREGTSPAFVGARPDATPPAPAADAASSAATRERLSQRATDMFTAAKPETTSEGRTASAPAGTPPAPVTAPPPIAGAPQKSLEAADASTVMSRREAATKSLPPPVPHGDAGTRPDVPATAPPPVLERQWHTTSGSSDAATGAIPSSAPLRDASRLSDEPTNPDERAKSETPAKPEERARSTEQALPQAASQHRAPLAATPRALPRIAGRLAVVDREAADRDLAALLSRVGGVETARRTEDGVTVVDVMVAGQTYAAFASGLARIGTWTTDAQPSNVSGLVTVTLRIAR